LSRNLKTAKALSLSVPATLLEALSDTCLTRSAQRPDFRRLMHGAKGGVAKSTGEQEPLDASPFQSPTVPTNVKRHDHVSLAALINARRMRWHLTKSHVIAYSGGMNG
jgi:hypothetical protein